MADLIKGLFMNGILKSSSLFLVVSLFTLVAYMHSARADDAIQDVAQAVIDMKELQMYYHVDKLPERIPLIIVKNEYTKNLRLKKFDTNVLLIEKQKLLKMKKTYFEFTVISIANDSAKVNFSYPAEGIYGNAELSRKDGQWLVASTKITER